MRTTIPTTSGCSPTSLTRSTTCGTTPRNTGWLIAMVVAIGSDFGAHELLQLCRRQGPLAHRQLRRHGEGPALDRSRGGRDRRAALRPPGEPRGRSAATTATGPSSTRSTCTRRCGATSALRTRLERSASHSTTPRTSRSSVEHRPLLASTSEPAEDLPEKARSVRRQVRYLG